MRPGAVVLCFCFIIAGFHSKVLAQSDFGLNQKNSPFFDQLTEFESTSMVTNNSVRQNSQSKWWSRRYLIDYGLIVGGTTGYIIGKGLTPGERSLIGPDFDPDNPSRIFEDERFSEIYLEQGVGETVPEYWMHRLLIGFGGVLITMEAVEWSRGNETGHRFHNTIVGYAETVALTAAATELTKPFFARLRPDFTERALRFHCPQSSLKSVEPFCNGFRDQPLDDDPDEARDLYDDGRKSFISGHSAHSFNLFGYSALAVGGRYVWGENVTTESRRAGIAGQTVMMASALFISYSRISDGRHHLSDVIVGSLTGFGIANLSYWTRFGRDGNLRRSGSGERTVSETGTTEIMIKPWLNPYSNGAGVRARLTF